MTSVIIALAIVLLLLIALRLWMTANRLDRLHIRTNSAWVALDGALQRRQVAVRAAAAAGAFGGHQVDGIRELTPGDDTADRARRAQQENDLSRWLAQAPPLEVPELAAELADAAERVTLARTFYNDAVRDTRTLRAVRFTRWFRLAGTAALPDFFEIADVRIALPQVRTAARVVLVAADDRILLFCSRDPDRVDSIPVWFTPGGGVEPGESLAETALRELAEETGLQLTADALIGPLWRRQARFTFGGLAYDQTEFYLVAAVDDAFEPDNAGFTALELRGITDQRWFSGEDLEQLDDIVYPVELLARLGEARRAARGAAVRPLSDIS